MATLTKTYITIETSDPQALEEALTLRKIEFECLTHSLKAREMLYTYNVFCTDPKTTFMLGVLYSNLRDSMVDKPSLNPATNNAL